MDKNVVDKIKQLRCKTGISIIKCKKALEKNNWNLYETCLFLRKNTFVKNEHVYSSNQGLICTLINDNNRSGIIVEVACKTDFVCKLLDFEVYVKSIAEEFLYDKIYKKNFSFQFREIAMFNNLENKRINLINKVSENIVIKRVRKLFSDENLIFGYTHGSNNLGRVGGIFLADKNILKCNELINLGPYSMNYVIAVPGQSTLTQETMAL